MPMKENQGHDLDFLTMKKRGLWLHHQSKQREHVKVGCTCNQFDRDQAMASMTMGKRFREKFKRRQSGLTIPNLLVQYYTPAHEAMRSL